jgi:hypothetical protein
VASQRVEANLGQRTEAGWLDLLVFQQSFWKIPMSVQYAPHDYIIRSGFVKVDMPLGISDKQVRAADAHNL